MPRYGTNCVILCFARSPGDGGGGPMVRRDGRGREREQYLKNNDV